MLEIAWNAKKTWNFEENFFSLNIKLKTTFPQYQKLHSTPPWLGARTCKVLRKYSNAFLSYSAKTKRDGQDRRTDRRGALQYLPSPGPTAQAGDKKQWVDINDEICPRVCSNYRPSDQTYIQWTKTMVFSAYIGLWIDLLQVAPLLSMSKRDKKWKTISPAWAILLHNI